MADKGQPSLAAVAIATGMLGLLAGYFLGQGSSIGLFDKSGHPNEVKKSWPNSYDVKVHADSSDEEGDDEHDGDDDEDEDGDGKELQAFEESNEEVKLVLAVRVDLGMGKGSPMALPFVHTSTYANRYQARSRHSVGTRHWLVTNISSAMPLQRRC